MSNLEYSTIADLAAGSQRDPAYLDGLLDEAGNARALRRMLLGITGLVAVALIWSFVAHVDELAKARGEVQPAQRVQVLQSQYGGQIEALLVQVGDRVQAGQVLARFAQSELVRDRTQVDVRRDALRIDLERWAALAEGRSPDFKAFAHRPKLVAEAQALFTEQRLAQRAMLESRQSAVQQQQSALRAVQAQLPAAETALRLAQDVEKRYADGVAQGVVTKMRLSEAREHVAEVSRNLIALRGRVAELEASVGTARGELAQTQRESAERARAKRSELLEQVQELDAQSTAVGAKQDLSELVAPVAGIVKQLPETRVGAVIAPGGVVAEIVPTEGGVLVEAMLSPKDIGFVREGQNVLVKVDAYDYSRFGAVRGKVQRISPTAFHQASNGAAYYKVDVALSQAHVGQDTSKLLLPGMSAEVDIVTGRKSVFQYLAKPVFMSADTAFHER
ncbi:MAG: HlyD family type I secretion periplasmic adaptor subunit [Rubrivivax sp.]|jgi:adhesin transport system membrane fusion protein|uniref:HlyD family type I secretion periplasmic adaptor subunit n=1 Tax=Roseateles sp. TaxID=1971397 RepID=UPI00391B689C